MRVWRYEFTNLLFVLWEWEFWLEGEREWEFRGPSPTNQFPRGGLVIEWEFSINGI